MNIEKKNTAIDWLIEQTRTPDWHLLKRGEILEIAKEIEKQQIKDAFNQGYREGETDLFERAKEDIKEYSDATIYFNQTFNTKKGK